MKFVHEDIKKFIKSSALKPISLGTAKAAKILSKCIFPVYGYS